jgi:hypothetical protein
MTPWSRATTAKRPEIEVIPIEVTPTQDLAGERDLESHKRDRRITYFEAALAVLRHAKRPLTTREISAAAVEEGLIVPKGRTPHASMTAALYQGLKSDNALVKLETPGPSRAQRGSVRWTLRDSRRARRR